LLAVAVGACSGGRHGAHFDFGTILHGIAVQHDFLVDPAATAGGAVPIAVELDCTCARASLVVLADDGGERTLDPLPLALRSLAPGERLHLRVRIDTSRLEAEDTEVEEHVAAIVFAPPESGDGGRNEVRCSFSFSIDSKIAITPRASVAFGDVPRSRERTEVVQIRSDDGRPIHAVDVRSDDQRLHASVVNIDDGIELHATLRPGNETQLGLFAGAIDVVTDRNGYAVRIPVRARLTSDLTASVAMLFLGEFDFDRDRPERTFVVTDHGSGGRSSFATPRVVAADGSDLSDSFAITLEPLDGAMPRTRVRVGWVGSATRQTVRAELVLRTDGAREETMRMPIRATHRAD
jgi:hypothetical protein